MTAVWITLASSGAFLIGVIVGAYSIGSRIMNCLERTGSLDDFRHITTDPEEA